MTTDNFPSLASLSASIAEGWTYGGRSDGYGRSFNVAYNTITHERRQWTTPATSLDCRCDICTVWHRKYGYAYHPDLLSLGEGTT